MAVNLQLPNHKMCNFAFCSMIGILLFMALKGSTLYYFFWESFTFEKMGDRFKAKDNV